MSTKLTGKTRWVEMYQHGKFQSCSFEVEEISSMKEIEVGVDGNTSEVKHEEKYYRQAGREDLRALGLIGEAQDISSIEG